MDEVNEMLTILSNTWINTNTNSKKPTFKRVIDEKRIPEASMAAYSYVLGYEIGRAVSPGAINVTDKEILTIALDLRNDDKIVSDGRAHSLNVRDEVVRIIRSKYGTNLATGSTFFVHQITNCKDLSDKSKMLYRQLIEVELWRIV